MSNELSAFDHSCIGISDAVNIEKEKINRMLQKTKCLQHPTCRFMAVILEKCIRKLDDVEDELDSLIGYVED
jgi:hypothetical protein